MAVLLEKAAAAEMQWLAPGLALYRRYLDERAQRLLVSEIAQIIAQAPWYVPRMPRSGRPFSVKMSNCGSLGWVSDRDGYRYQPMHPATGTAWPRIPSTLVGIWYALASCPQEPEACLINFYDSGARMGLHQDRDELDLTAPVVSISLGDSCAFRYGGLRRRDPAERIELCSGDAVVLGGPSRLIFHGVDKIFPGSSALLPGGGRVNLTLRRVTLP